MLLGTGSAAPSWSASKPTARRPRSPSRSPCGSCRSWRRPVAPEPAAVAPDHGHRHVHPGAPGGRSRSRSGRQEVGPRSPAHAGRGGRVTFTAPYAWRGAPATYRVVGSQRADRAESSRERADRRLGHADPLRRVLRDGARGAVGPPLPGLRGPEPSLLEDRPARDRGRWWRRCPSASSTTRTVTTRAPSPTTRVCEQSTFYRLNGHVGTQGRFAYKYGVAAARIRFQDLRGQHGAFWMQAPRRRVRRRDRRHRVVRHRFVRAGQRRLDLRRRRPRRGSPRRRPATMRVRLGLGRPTTCSRSSGRPRSTSSASTAGDAAHDAGVSQTEEYLILSLLVSNFESLRVTSPDQLPQTMAVDWVRVWQK